MVGRRYLSTSDLARICQVTPVTVGNWIRSGKLKASRVAGGNYRMTAEDLVRFLQRAHMEVPASLLGHEPRVLIISEEQASVQRISSMLAEGDEDWQIETARNCFSAGVKLMETGPDLVIVELPMSGMAANIGRQIREAPGWRDVKVLAIIPCGESSEPAKAKQIGADRCLGKDASGDELRAAASALLYGSGSKGSGS